MTDAARVEERWSADQIIDAGHALGWPDHDIALLVAMLQERS